MKRLFAFVFVFFAAFSVPAWSAPVSFAFAGVPLVQFAQATYRDLLHRDFVVSSDLLSVGKKVTINVRAVDVDKLPAFVDQVLLSQGIRSSLRSGVYFLEPAGADLSPAVHQVDQVPAAAAVPSAQPGAAASASQPGADVPAPPKDKDEFRVVQVMNRPVEFVAQAVNSIVGPNVARPGGGSRLVVSAPKDRLDVVSDLVAQLDVGVDQVEVSASFVEVTTSGSDASGLSLVAGMISRKLGVTVQPSQGRIAVSAGRYDLVLDALAGDGRFNQVSNSRVVGDEAEHFSLSVGDETPTIGSTGKDQLGNAVQNVVYRPSGVILDVLPRVLGSRRLSLVVDGQVSAFQSTTTGVAGSPTLVKRQVKTSVSVADGEVLVIGGLNDSKSTRSKTGFSFLPSSWASRNGSDNKTDLVLILSARLLSPDRTRAKDAPAVNSNL
jgi:type II secretory pathway component GspD/PulD (secretin)